MSNWDSGSTPQLSFPKPGKALTGVMLTLFFVWLMFAIAINWGGASMELFTLFCGNDAALLSGFEVWRLFTAPFMTYPQGQVSSIIFTLIGFYFLTPSLESKWGSARLLRFLAGAALFSYLFQLLVAQLLPVGTAAKLVGEYWFGPYPVIEAVAIAWALSFKGQQVRLMFVLPVTATQLAWFVVGMSVLMVIAMARPPSGLVAPFGGMLAGWLLGGGTPSPLRRFYLKFKLQQMERGMEREKQERSSRVAKSRFDVIEGGKNDKSSKKPKRGPDGKYLN